MKRASLQFSLPVSVLKEDNRYIAYTPALDLSTSGKSYAEAKERFAEILHIFFDEIAKAGTLERVLTDSGWKKVRSEWKPPVVVSQDVEEVSVSA